MNALLSILGQNLGFDVGFPELPNEIIMDTEEGNLREIGHILKSQNEGNVWTRHYSFVDFKQFGFTWWPHWISIIRDPIERVSKPFIVQHL